MNIHPSESVGFSCLISGDSLSYLGVSVRSQCLHDTQSLGMSPDKACGYDDAPQPSGRSPG